MASFGFVVLLVLLPFLSWAGASLTPSGRTGAPADGGQTCAACHTASAPLNLGPGRVAVRAHHYTPGQRQTLTVEISDPLAERWGFQLTARLASNENLAAGTFLASPTIQVRCLSGTLPPCAGQPEFVSHVASSTAGGAVGVRSFNVDWDAPANDSGPVVFYVAALGANGDGTATGDFTYTNRAVLVPRGSILRTFSLHSANPPGGKGTIGRAVNSFGQVAGHFYADGRERAYVREANGQVTAFDVPGAQDTLAYGINDHAEVVGVYDGNRGFLRRADGNFLFLNIPGTVATRAYAINNAGVIVGSYVGADGKERGFVRSADGGISTFEEPLTLPGAGTPAPPSIRTEIRGVNGQGEMLGNSVERYPATADGSVADYFLNSFLIEPGGGKTYLRRFEALGRTPESETTGLNAGRWFAGWAPGAEGFVGMVLGPGGQRVPFSLGGAPSTFPFGINDQNVLVGALADAQGVRTAFVNSPCVAPVSPNWRGHGSGAEAGAIEVLSEPNCLWFARSTVPWIVITDPLPAGAAGGQVSYRLEANFGTPRAGNIEVAGHTVTITQVGSECSFSVSPLASQLPAGATSLRLSVETGANCPWTGSAGGDATLWPAAGYGPGEVEMRFPPNAGVTPVTHIVQVGGREVTVTQSGIPCGFALDPLEATAAAGGQTGTVQVTANALCTWNALPNEFWLEVTSGIAGAGNGTVTWKARPNLSASQRVGTITIAGIPFTVTQPPPPGGCQFILSKLFQAAPPGGGGFLLSVETGAGCHWDAATQTPWITLVGSTSGGPDGLLSYQVAGNQDAAPRWGSIQIAGQTVTVAQAGQLSVTGLRFVPIPPCRLVDTRPDSGSGLSGPFGPPKLAAGSSREIPVPQGRCGIPSAALAYSANLTVVPDGYLGYASLVPKGFAGPPVSTLNSWNGRVVANAAIVPAGPDGAVTVLASDATHVILDLNGYFVAPSDPQGLDFHPFPPCRVVDTRLDYPFPYGQPRLEEQASRGFPVVGNPNCATPQDARAYSLNATVVPPGPLGYLTLWPTGSMQPFVSTLNSWNGQVVANAAIVPAGTGGGISAFAANATELILDFNGTFRQQGSTGGLKFYPLPPCRLVDTRGEAGLPADYGPPRLEADMTGRRFSVLDGGCGVPAAARAYVLNVTVVPFGGLPYLTVWPADRAAPFASTLNSWDGQVVANMALVPASPDGAIRVGATAPTHLIIDVYGYFAP